MGDSFIDVSRRVIEHPVSHLRVLGPPGSGKTWLLAERFRALEKRLRAGWIPRGRRGSGRKTEPVGKDADLEGVFILTYSAESHKRLTEAVFDKDTARVGPPPVYTYTRLAQEIVESSCGRPPEFLADLEERLILEDVIARGESTMVSELRSICRTERFMDELLRACRILMQNGVGADALHEVFRYNPAVMSVVDLPKFDEPLERVSGPELADIAWIYNEYRRAIEESGAVTYYDVAWAAVKRLREGNVSHPLMRAVAILVEDFQDIDAGQFELLKSIAPPTGRVALNVFGDPLGSVFAYRGTQHAYLAAEFPRLYGAETFLLPARCRRGGAPETTIEALLAETLGEDARGYLPAVGAGEGEPPGDLRLEIARDEVDEAWTVAARVASILRRGDCRPEEIAVISNDKHSYEPILTAAATQRGIPLDTGRARKGVLGDLIDALLTLVDSPHDPIASRSVVTSPLFPWLMVLYGGAPAGATDAARELENLRAFTREIRREIAASAPEKWMRIVAVRVLDPLCAVLAKETGDDSAYLETSAILDAWETYSRGVDRWRVRPSLAWFVAMRSRFEVRRSPGWRGSVSLLSPREAKGRYFPVVFVMGCSELLFPSAARGESILPLERLEEVMRAILPGRPISIHAARGPAQQLAEEQHLLYVALTRSTKSLFITAPAVFGGDEYPAPSSILDRTIPASERGETAPGEKTPPQIRFAKTWVEGGPVARCGGALERLSPAGAHWHSPEPAPAPVPLEPFRLSKSSIETYLGCARQFFYRKVLRVPEIEDPAAKAGSLLHQVMADLGARFPRKTDLIAGCTPAVVNEAVDEALRRDGTVGNDSFFERSLRHHLAVMVGWILDLEREDPQDHTIAATEQTIVFSRGPWEFTGRIDRIDAAPSGEKTIVDYKTGKLDKKGETLRAKTLYALDRPEDANWQVPLYVWGMKAVDGSTPSAFAHIVTRAGEQPFRVTLLIRRREEDAPPGTKKDKRTSYLLESEIEAIMDRAVKVAEEIFAARTRFERTADTQACRTCDFARICGREQR